MFRKPCQGVPVVKLKPYSIKLKNTDNRTRQKPKLVSVNLEAKIRTINLYADIPVASNIQNKKSQNKENFKNFQEK